MSTANLLTRVNAEKQAQRLALIDKGVDMSNVVFENYHEKIAAITGGTAINGIIERYKVAAGEIVNAGEFVRLVNESFVSYQSEEQLSSIDYAGVHGSAVLLPDNRVFIAHSSGSSYTLYGMLITIRGASITVDADVQLSSVSYSGYRVGAILLRDSRIFIAHSSSISNHLYGMLVTIDGPTISTGTDTQLSSASGSGAVISPVLLADGKVFIAHSYNSSSYLLYGMLVTIDGPTISKGTDTQLSNVSQTGFSIDALLMANGRVFIAHTNSSSYLLYGMLVTISGSTISKGTDTLLSDVTRAGFMIRAALMLDGKVFIAHSSSVSSHLYGMLVTISGTSISAGTDVLLSNATNAGAAISVVLMGPDSVLVTHSGETSYYLFGMLVKVSGATVTAGEDVLLSSQNGSGNMVNVILIADGTALITRNSGSGQAYSLFGTLVSNLAVRRAYRGDSGIIGIAQTDTHDSMVDVYVPTAA